MRKLKGGTWFGFAEVEIEIPEALWPKFDEMCPFFINKEVPAEAVPEHMLKYVKQTGWTRGKGRKLMGALSAERMLVYAPLLQWYVDHRAVITTVHRKINYQLKNIFLWFVEQVTVARRTEDADKSKALLAIFRLLGNSAYGKMIEAVERQTNEIRRLLTELCEAHFSAILMGWGKRTSWKAESRGSQSGGHSRSGSWCTN